MRALQERCYKNGVRQGICGHYIGETYVVTNLLQIRIDYKRSVTVKLN